MTNGELVRYCILCRVIRLDKAVTVLVKVLAVSIWWDWVRE